MASFFISPGEACLSPGASAPPRSAAQVAGPYAYFFLRAWNFGSRSFQIAYSGLATAMEE